MITAAKIVKERGKRYGTFFTQAGVAQRLKRAIKVELAGKVLAYDQEEALEMFALKISRIVHGDEDYADSWRDIEGYAKLVADRLEGVKQ